jgi:hypothetical protein
VGKGGVEKCPPPPPSPTKPLLVSGKGPNSLILSGIDRSNRQFLTPSMILSSTQMIQKLNF